MNILLDTHIALWAITDDARLAEQTKRLLLAHDARIWVSAASLWEIAIKHQIHPQKIPLSALAALDVFRETGFEFLPVSAQHAAAVESLPLLHNDPFDRILIAQALTEPMCLISHDKKVLQYSDSFIGA